MKNKVEEAGLPVEVEHISVKNITEEPDLIVTTNALKARVEDTIAKYEKEIPVFGVDNLLDESKYDELIAMLKETGIGISSILFAAKKYNGDISYRKDNGKLTVCVILKPNKF